MRAARRFVVAIAMASLAGGTTAAFAQTRPARLLVTVVDPSGGVIPGAEVTVTGNEDATRKTPIAPLKTTDQAWRCLRAWPPAATLWPLNSTALNAPC
jgi:hypothetical protein